MIKKSVGLTESEKYLSFLCEKTFLSLWSYPNVFKEKGKELCDLLVIVENDIIIFSDKHCVFPNTENLELDWKRWFRRAIADSANQLWGTEKWIKKYPDKVFIDNKCQIPLPIKIDINEETKFHLILVAHGSSKRCKEIYLESKGSLMFDNEVIGVDNHTEPFVVGDLDPYKTFIHILDDCTLDILLKTRDTIIDFTTYLTKKEKFVRSDFSVYAAGEEELLAFYLKEINENGEHDFVLPNNDKSFTHVILEEGGWQNFQNHPQRIAQINADKISYLWDRLIETFCTHAFLGTQYYYEGSNGISDGEKAIRMLAQETRFDRRRLAKNFKETIMTTPANLRKLRLVILEKSQKYYVFLLSPHPNGISNKNYRDVRADFLEGACLVTKLHHPNAKHIIGIATESGLNLKPRSEDLIYFKCDKWDDETRKLALEYKEKYRIWVSPKQSERIDQEYPDVG